MALSIIELISCGVDKAIELTEKGKGKHHIGDFLPPDEMEKFLEKVQAIKEGRDPGMRLSYIGVIVERFDAFSCSCRFFRLQG